MAEAVFRSFTHSNPKISHVDSAGTGGYHIGSAPDPRTMATLEEHGISDYEHGARQVQLSDFKDFDYVLAMDRDNLRDLQRLRVRAASKGADDGEGKGRVMLFGKFGGRKEEEVADPYYGANDGFEIAYEQMVRFSRGFLEEVLGETDDSKT